MLALLFFWFYVIFSLQYILSETWLFYLIPIIEIEKFPYIFLVAELLSQPLVTIVKPLGLASCGSLFSGEGGFFFRCAPTFVGFILILGLELLIVFFINKFIVVKLWRKKWN